MSIHMGDFPFRAALAGALVRVACLAVIAAPLTAAAADRELSLQDSLRIATELAPMLQARSAAVLSAREEAARSDALPDPVLLFGVENLPVTGDDAFDTGTDEMTMQRIGVRQDIPSRAKRAARRTLAQRQVGEAEAQSAMELQAVRRATAESWIDLWAAERKLAAMQSLREQATLASRLARARVAAGAASTSEALAVDAAMLELDNRVESARAEKAAAQAELARWVLDPVVEASGGTPEFQSLPVSEAQLLAKVDRSGPVLPAAAQVETAAAAIDVARSDKRPDWSIGAAYGRREGERSDMITLEVGIGLPLFPRNRQDRGIAAREADYQVALATREDLRRRETARIRAGIARWESLKRQVALHERSLLPLARDRSATALAAYRAGGELQPWLDARRDELEVHLSHAEHLGELGRAWAALAFVLPGTQP